MLDVTDNYGQKMCCIQCKMDPGTTEYLILFEKIEITTYIMLC